MDKTLFITGASTGIGAATAQAAVKAGWQVGLFARSKDKLEALAESLGGSLHGAMTSLWRSLVPEQRDVTPEALLRKLQRHHSPENVGSGHVDGEFDRRALSGTRRLPSDRRFRGHMR